MTKFNVNGTSPWSLSLLQKVIKALKFLLKTTGQGGKPAQAAKLTDVPGLHLDNGDQVYVAETKTVYIVIDGALQSIVTSE